MRGVERFVFEQGFGENFDSSAPLIELPLGAGIGFVDDAFDLGVDLLGGGFTVFAGTGEVAGKEDMLAALGEADHAERAHAPFANHLAG